MSEQSPYGPPPGPPPFTRKGPSTAVVVVVVVVAAVVLVGSLGGLAWIAYDRVAADRSAQPGTSGSEAGEGDGGDGSAYGDAPPPDAAALQETWAEGDDTFLFELDALPAGWRGARHWGCLQVQQGDTSTRYACRDDGGTFPTEPRHDPPMTARLEVNACDAPCPVDTTEQLTAASGSFAETVGSLRQLDARTWWAEAPSSSDGLSALLVRSTDTDGDDRPDAVLWAFFSAPPEDADAVGKALRDIWDRMD